MKLLLLLFLINVVNSHPCAINKVTHLDTGECIDYCPAGSQYGIMYNRTLCSHCLNGKFSDKNNSECVDWTECNFELNESVFQEGTSTSDRICSCPYFLVDNNMCTHNCSLTSYYSEENLDNTSRFSYNCYARNLTENIFSESSTNEMNYVMIGIIGGSVILFLFLVYIIVRCYNINSISA